MTIFADVIGVVRAALVGGQIKSIQRGTITIDTSSVTSGTATIASVTTGKAWLNYLGVSGQWADGTTVVWPGRAVHRLTLTNATTVTANIGSNLTGGTTITISFEVVEFY